MKKIDKLILGSFLGPFLLTFLVVDFILLTQYMMKYFDEIMMRDNRDNFSQSDIRKMVKLLAEC